jgi:hypothetical protein
MTQPMLGLLTLLLLSTNVTGQTLAVVRESVENFCKFEFDGAQDAAQRAEMAHFSDSRVHELKAIMDGVSPYVFEWEASPLDVVESYKVGEVESSGNEATAKVTYEVLARRDSWGHEIKVTPKKVVNVQLRLQRDGEHWKIIDPPFPRVSKNFLSSSYRGMVELPQTWYQHASKAQFLRLRKAIDTILFLDALK